MVLSKHSPNRRKEVGGVTPLSTSRRTKAAPAIQYNDRDEVISMASTTRRGHE
jgi:hypothetical protein